MQFLSIILIINFLEEMFKMQSLIEIQQVLSRHQVLRNLTKYVFHCFFIVAGNSY